MVLSSNIALKNASIIEKLSIYFVNILIILAYFIDNEDDNNERHLVQLFDFHNDIKSGKK